MIDSLKKYNCWFACFLSLALANSGLTASNPPNATVLPISTPQSDSSDVLQMIGQIGGALHAIAVNGNRAYLGEGVRMVVIDISDPDSPIEIGSTEPLDSFVKGITLQGKIAFVSVLDAGLYLYDIQNPSSPKLISRFDSIGLVENSVVVDKTAYVADGWNGLEILDISDLANPIRIGGTRIPGYAYDLVMQDQKSYIAGADGGLIVVDVSDPKAPKVIGTHVTPGYSHGVDVDGQYAYLADEWEGLRIIDISIPSQPREISSFDSAGWTFDVEVGNGRAFLADAFAGLRILEIRDPAHPVEIGFLEELGGHSHRLSISGEKGYVADRNLGLRIIDLSDPFQPVQVGRFGSLSNACHMEVIGSYAYVGVLPNRLWVVDISDPAHPRRITEFQFNKDILLDIDLCSDPQRPFLYLGSGFDEKATHLYVIDISNPINPRIIGTYHEGSGAGWDLVYQNNLICYANEFGLRVVDVSNPENPKAISFVDCHNAGQSTYCLAIDDHNILIGGMPVRIIDISDPKTPREVSTLENPGNYDATSIFVLNNTAYISYRDNNFGVYDISDVTNPKLLGDYRFDNAVYNLTSLNNYILGDLHSAGIGVASIHNPAQLQLLPSVHTIGYVKEVVVFGSYLYVASSLGGMIIYELKSSRQTNLLSMENRRNQTLTHFSPVQYSKSLEIPETIHTSLKKGFIEPRLNQLYSIQVQAVTQEWIVTTANDSGGGSLRESMKNAQPGDVITFDPAVFPPAQPATISLQQGLPSLSKGNVTIDGSNAGVILDGGPYKINEGFQIASNGNRIMGLQILNYKTDGINFIREASPAFNIIGGNRNTGKGPTGQGNVISGNGVNGISLWTSCHDNEILGNLIGTDSSGTQPMGNGWSGIELAGVQNRIGYNRPGENNVICSNGYAGIMFRGQTTKDNIIDGNYIGVDITGSQPLGNIGYHACSGDIGNYNCTISNNVISGNNEGGLIVPHYYLKIYGNKLGTDYTGMKPILNGWVSLSSAGDNYNVIGGKEIDKRNIICGSMILDGWNDIVLGNFLGTDSSGIKRIEEKEDDYGIGIEGRFIHIGGYLDQSKNVINKNFSININRSQYVIVSGNYVGVDADGRSATITETKQDVITRGILVDNSHHCAIYKNLISGNPINLLVWYGSSFNSVIENMMGTDSSGLKGVTNNGDGILMANGAHHNSIMKNLIGCNNIGIEMKTFFVDNDKKYTNTYENIIAGNYIGTDKTGEVPLPNKVGISIGGGIEGKVERNMIGDINSDKSNVIRYNKNEAIFIDGQKYNSIRRNMITENGNGISITNLTLPVPNIVSILDNHIFGTCDAPDQSQIEIFNDQGNQGKTYIGTAILAKGQFDFEGIIPKEGNITATVTDLDGTTSMFSLPFSAKYTPTPTRIPTPIPEIPKRISGLWEFNDPANPLAATIGQDLKLVGKHTIINGIDSHDRAAAVPTGSYYRVYHGLNANGGGMNVNQYSLLIDFRVPDFDNWRIFINTDPLNQDDGEAWLGDARIGYGGKIGDSISDSKTTMTPNNWYRLVIVYDLPAQNIFYYIDGILVHKSHSTESLIDSRFYFLSVDHSNTPWFLIFADENGEDGPIDVTTIALFDYSLSSGEISALKVPGSVIVADLSTPTPIYTPIPITTPTYSPTPKPVRILGWKYY